MKKDKFIENARNVHGDRYDYSLVPDEFLSVNKVKIICKEHGVFLQTNGNHVWNKCGCPVCNAERLATGNSIRKSKEHYIEKIKQVHGDKYDLSLFEYETCTKKSTVVCEIHGNFQVSLDNLSRGKGCPKCGRKATSDSLSKPIEYFIEMARKSHKNFYNYSKVDCESRFDYCTVVCPEHGDFRVKLETHARGSSNCPSCVLERRNKWSLSKMLLDEPYWRSRACYLYFIKITHQDKTFFKVGISSDLSKRFKLIESELLGCTIEVVHKYLSDYIDSLKLERLFKKGNKVRKYKHHQQFGGYTECYYFTDEELKEVESFFNQAALS